MDKANRKKLMAITDRAAKLVEGLGLAACKVDIMMDLEAAHRDTPLDFDKLLAFDDGNFGHDISGIRHHLNRRTGELEDCFVPRCALVA